MRFKKELFKMYVCIVVLPTIFFTTILAFYQHNNLKQQHFQEAKVNAEILSDSIESFMVELASDLELLANLIDIEDRDSLKYSLQLMRDKYIHAQDFYFTNNEGYIIVTSTNSNEAHNIQFRSYFHAVLRMKKTQIYFVHDSTLNGYVPSIVVASPVFDNENEVIGILIGNIPPKTIINYRPTIERRGNYILIDRATGTDIINMASNPDSTDYISLDIAGTNWTLEVYVEDPSIKEIAMPIFIIFLICILITHLVFFITKSFYEKKKLEEENQRNAMNRLKLVGKMAGIFAHEIRNPLTGIMGFITLLKDTNPSEENQMYYSIIETELTRINNIVGEFLVLGKPISVDKNIHDLRDIMKEIYPIIMSKAQVVDVLTKIDIVDKPLPLYCNNGHIKQLILNITQNAIEASEPNDLVNIFIDENRNHIIITIADNGSGISEELIKELYAPFITTKKDGTGLGLVISKQIVEMYNGTISMESTLNVGTVFTITFPLG